MSNDEYKMPSLTLVSRKKNDKKIRFYFWERNKLSLYTPSNALWSRRTISHYYWLLIFFTLFLWLVTKNELFMRVSQKCLKIRQKILFIAWKREWHRYEAIKCHCLRKPGRGHGSRSTDSFHISAVFNLCWDRMNEILFAWWTTFSKIVFSKLRQFVRKWNTSLYSLLP